MNAERGRVSTTHRLSAFSIFSQAYYIIGSKMPNNAVALGTGREADFAKIGHSISNAPSKEMNLKISIECSFELYENITIHISIHVSSPRGRNSTVLPHDARCSS
jgi:hypothetical protein